MINRTKVKESTQIKPGDNGDVLVMKDNAPEWSTPSDAGLAEQANVDSELSKKQDKLVAGDNIHIDGNTISADGKPTPINIGTVISGEVPMVSNSGTDTDVVLNFVLPKGDKGDPGKDGTQINSIAPLVVKTTPVANRPEDNLAIGNGAVANTGLEQLAVGARATCSASYSTAVGASATAEGTATTAVGCEAYANSTGSTTEGATVVGFGALTSPSSKGGTAIGGNSYVVEDFGTAIGTSATASASESVAIGHNSYTTRDHEVSVGKPHGVSRPDNAFTRVISNVTDPTELQDAATKNYVDTKIAEIPAGAQINSILPLTVDTPPDEGSGTGNVLFGDNVRITSGGSRGGVGVGVDVITSYGAVSIGDTANAGTLAIAIGARSYAEGYGSNTGGIALGENARTDDSAAVAIGANSSVTRPDGGRAQYSVALGPYSSATEEGIVSVGSGVTTLTLSDDMTEEQQVAARAAADVPTRRIVNVTDPRDAQDAATKSYVDTKISEIPAGTEVNTLSTPTTTGILDFGENSGSLFYGYQIAGKPLTVPTGYEYVGIGRIPNDEISSDDPLSLDGGIVVTPGSGGVVVGRGIPADSIIIGEPNDGVNLGSNRVAIGTNIETSASGEGTVAIGGGRAEGDYAIAIGQNSYTASSDAFAVGRDDGDAPDEGDEFRRRVVGVKDPINAQDAATKNYVDTQLTPINAKLQYVPENTNQILSQIQTNVEKAQSAADAKVASITAGTGISVDASNPTAPVVSTTGLATQSSVDALTSTVNSKANQTDLEALQTTVAGKADTSALANYATKTELSAKADQSAVDAKVSSVTAGTGISITGSATAPVVNGMIAVPDYDNAQYVPSASSEGDFTAPSDGVIYRVQMNDLHAGGQAMLSIKVSESSDQIVLSTATNSSDATGSVSVAGVFPVQKGTLAWVDRNNGQSDVSALFYFAPYKFVEIS